MGYKYAYQKGGSVAKASTQNAPVSTKTAIMMCNFIKGKPVARVQRELGEVLKMKQAVPFTRFFEGAGHKAGMASGKFPQKCTKEILRLVNSAAANATDMGMGDDIVIISANANKGSKQPKHGRHRGRMAKATHIEVVVAEADPRTKKPAKKPTAAKKAPAKKEEKPAQAKEEPVKEEKKVAEKKADPKPAKEEKKATPKAETKTEAKSPAQKKKAPAKQSSSDSKQSNEESN